MPAVTKANGVVPAIQARRSWACLRFIDTVLRHSISTRYYGIVWLPTAATHRPIRRQTRGNAYVRPRRTQAPSGAGFTAALACRGRPRASSSALLPRRRAPDRSAPAATCGGRCSSSSSRCAPPPSTAACRGHLPSSCSALRAFQDRRRGKISFPRSDQNSEPGSSFGDAFNRKKADLLALLSY